MGPILPANERQAPPFTSIELVKDQQRVWNKVVEGKCQLHKRSFLFLFLHVVALGVGISWALKCRAIAATNEPVIVFSDVWSYDVTDSAPQEDYPVLAVTEVNDGDTFEAILHIAPQLLTHVRIRLENARAPEKDTPEGKELREEIVTIVRMLTG
jgi:hypothetical protein